MTVFGSRSASSRRTIVAGLLAAALVAGVNLHAQQAAPAPAQEDPFKFSTGSGAFLWFVKADKTADFEAAWKEIRSKLSASDKADVKELGDSLKMYKIDAPPSAQGVSYLFVADPASKTLSYSPSPFILFQSGLFADADARKLFDTLNGASSGINPLPLVKIP
jgi:hypothetical protein